MPPSLPPLFAPGVSRVLLGSNFVTVTKAAEASWDVLKPEVFAALMDFFLSSQPLITPAGLQRLAAGTSQPGAELSSDQRLNVR